MLENWSTDIFISVDLGEELFLVHSVLTNFKQENASTSLSNTLKSYRLGAYFNGSQVNVPVEKRSYGGDMDLAESVDDLICTFDGTGDTTMDTLAMFIFGWILAALFVLWLGRLIYGKFVVKQKINESKSKVDANKTETTGLDVVDARGVKKSVSVASSIASKAAKSGGYVPPTPPVRKRLTRQSPAPDLKKTKYVPAPQCTGADNICVLWVNDVFQWLYNDLVIVNELLSLWIQSLNDYTKKSVAEVSLGISIL